MTAAGILSVGARAGASGPSLLMAAVASTAKTHDANKQARYRVTLLLRQDKWSTFEAAPHFPYRKLIGLPGTTATLADRM